MQCQDSIKVYLTTSLKIWINNFPVPNLYNIKLFLCLLLNNTICGPWNLCDLGRLTVQNRPKGTKHIVGPSSDQSCWLVYLPTNNIASTTCNIIGALYAPTILHGHRAKCLHGDGAKCCWFWEGQLAVWLLAVGSWQLSDGSGLLAVVEFIQFNSIAL